MTLKHLIVGAAAAAATLAPQFAAAQQFPSKPVKIVVGAAPGSTPDLMARLIGQKLSEAWGGSPVVVENKPGVAGSIAAEAMLSAPADGYTLLLADGTAWGTNPYLYSKLPYDPKRLLPIVQIGFSPSFMVVNDAVPAKNVQELIGYAKQNPTKLNYATIGPGSMHHLSAEQFKSQAGINMVHVPYKGGAQIGMALMSGEAQVSFVGYAGVLSGLNAGKVRVLGVTTEQRAASHPNIPTVAEAGLPGFSMPPVNLGFLAATGTPPEVVGRIATAIASALQAPEVRNKLSDVGVIVTPQSTPEQFANVMRTDNERLGKAIQAIGLKLD